MCRRVQCSRCGKPGFAGCGAHVEQVLAGVPPADRCRCHEASRGEATKAATQPPPSGTWLAHLLRNRGANR
jgi:hypothetical protein